MPYKTVSRYWKLVLFIAAFILGLASASVWGLRGALILFGVGILATPLITGLIWVVEEAVFRWARPDEPQTSEEHGSGGRY